LAGGSKPPILRVLISNGSIGNSTESRNLLHSVVTSSSSTKVVPGYMGSPKEKTVDLGYMVSPKEKTMDLGYVVGHKEKSMDFGYVEKPENNPFIKPVGVEELISVNPNIEKNVPEKQNGKESSPRTFTFPTPASSKQVFNTTKKETGAAATAKPLPVIYVSGKPFVPKSKLEGSTIGVPEPLQQQQPQPQKKESLVSKTNNLAESISSLVLESSDSTLQSSTNYSAAISLQTEKLSQQTGEDNYKIAAQIFSTTNQISSRSEAGELEENFRRSLSDACTETGKNSSKLSDEIAAITNCHSVQIAAHVDPISKHTRNLQAAATEGLEDHLTQGVDALVRDIMKATSVV
jgi:hypothetical protein